MPHGQDERLSFGALRQAFFDEYIERQPEEASTLGLYAGAGRLRDHRPQALAEERRWYADMAGRLDATDRAAMGVDEALDHLAMERLVTHHLHTWERMWCAVDWSTYPYNMVAVQSVHAGDDPEALRALGDRVGGIPRFLEQHEANVMQGLDDGIRPDGALCTFFADHQLPPASRFLRHELSAVVGDRAVAAADAYDRHIAWLTDRILPRATPAQRAGDAEIRWRLEHTFGIRDDPRQLIARARLELERVQEQLVECAARVEPTVRSIEDVRTLANRMQEKTFDKDEDVIPAYRAYVDRARRVVEEKRLFEVPEDYVIGIDALPPGFSVAATAGNWPAPLLDRSKLGHFLVAAEATAHRVAWAADGAVHEGLPGHHLQSFWWQRHFGDDPAPVRFLLVHDQVAIPRHYWGLMLNIEGYAVYSEEVMRRAGFFTPAEELFVLMAHGVRAARVIVDLSLHCELMDEAEAVRVLTLGVGMAEPLARVEVRRYLQTPLQASTYLLGRLAIEDLVVEVREHEGAAFDLPRFHERFFSFGTSDPVSIRRHWRTPRLG